jgi:nucleotide-binding universal stress UspA family protein
MKRIVVAYDGSPCSDAALDDLRHAGLPASLDVKVVSVADVWLTPASGVQPVYPDAVLKAATRARERAEKEVERSQVLAEIGAKRVKKIFPAWLVQSKGVAGSPAAVIVKEATSADLVVLGSHSRSTLGRLFLGSTAQRVAIDAYCSVRIARPRPHLVHPRLRILIGVDGSPESQAAVNEVAKRNWPPWAEFRLITVVDSNLETAVAWPNVVPSEWVEATDERSYDWAGRMLGSFGTILRDAGLKTETDIFDGHPKEVLLREAETWNADTLFLGRRGLQHADRLFLGSTASAIAARAHCSVEIVRSEIRKATIRGK